LYEKRNSQTLRIATKGGYVAAAGVLWRFGLHPSSRLLDSTSPGSHTLEAVRAILVIARLIGHQR
jgi:hypothetical protein